MKQENQISESKRLAFLLAMSGGLMDAYTYIYRGQVFANAQTGNILLFGVNLSVGNFRKALQYFLPVFFFAVGIILAEVIRHFCLEKDTFHWRQFTVLAECVILFFVGFVSRKHNLIANSFVSFACGIQVESFRKVRGNAFATTMCIGNLRSGTQALCDFFFQKDFTYLKKGMTYYGVIFAFTIGAILGNILITIFATKAIWCSCILLLMGFLLMFIQEEKEQLA